MKFLELKKHFASFFIFSLDDIRKIEPGFYRVQLNQWQERGLIKKLSRNKYIFSDLEIDELTLFYFANRLYAPSYISFQSALSFYNLIPEGVYSVTSATTRHTRVIDTDLGSFKYRTLKNDLMFGYQLVSLREKHSVKIAEPEKAILDYLYMNANLDDINAMTSLRFNSEVFNEIIDKDKIEGYLNSFNSKILRKRYKLLNTAVQHASA